MMTASGTVVVCRWRATGVPLGRLPAAHLQLNISPSATALTVNLGVAQRSRNDGSSDTLSAVDPVHHTRVHDETCPGDNLGLQNERAEPAVDAIGPVATRVVPIRPRVGHTSDIRATPIGATRKASAVSKHDGVVSGSRHETRSTGDGLWVAVFKLR